MGDGHLNKCKDCTITDSENRRKIKEQDLKWVLSERKRHREKAERFRNEGRASKQKNETKANWEKQNPEKKKAHNAVNNALRYGKIHRHPCCICGSKAEAHHEDYSKPLDVIWLCPKHHGEHHAKKRDQEIMNSFSQENK
jgi:hypothetical protein